MKSVKATCLPTVGKDHARLRGMERGGLVGPQRKSWHLNVCLMTMNLSATWSRAAPAFLVPLLTRCVCRSVLNQTPFETQANGAVDDQMDKATTTAWYVAPCLSRPFPKLGRRNAGQAKPDTKESRPRGVGGRRVFDASGFQASSSRAVASRGASLEPHKRPSSTRVSSHVNRQIGRQAR
jgi:hypothetical protein